jgi:hypothetical protein
MDELFVWFHLIAGPHASYSFMECFNWQHRNRRESELINGALYLIDTGNPDAVDWARLVRRIVNGVQTLGIRGWGWR